MVAKVSAAGHAETGCIKVGGAGANKTSTPHCILADNGTNY